MSFWPGIASTAAPSGWSEESGCLVTFIHPGITVQPQLEAAVLDPGQGREGRGGESGRVWEGGRPNLPNVGPAHVGEAEIGGGSYTDTRLTLGWAKVMSRAPDEADESATD